MSPAIPYLRASELVSALLERHLVPAAQAFVRDSEALRDAIGVASPADCRSKWVTCMLSWEQLASVPVGALLERRSVRTLDFWPTRPAQIQALLEEADPARWSSAQNWASIGVSAKGLPALEWLLFRQQTSPVSMRYAAALADQVLDEARILAQACMTLQQTVWDEADAWTTYGEWFGQALGSLDQLRLKKTKPHTRGKDSSVWIRGVSRQTQAAWQAHAAGLQAFFTGALPPRFESNCPLPHPEPGALAELLLSRGYPSETAKLQQLTASMVRALQHAKPDQPLSLQAAQQTMSALHQFATGIGAELFDFSTGFTDADGD